MNLSWRILYRGRTEGGVPEVTLFEGTVGTFVEKVTVTRNKRMLIYSVFTRDQTKPILITRNKYSKVMKKEGRVFDFLLIPTVLTLARLESLCMQIYGCISPINNI